jgi:hypothetical protein
LLKVSLKNLEISAGWERHTRAECQDLEANYVGGLEALGAGGNFKFNGLSFVQRLVTFRLNGGKMYEDVFAGLALDKSISFACVKPLHGTLFFHRCSSTLSLSAICCLPTASNFFVLMPILKAFASSDPR